MGEGNGGCAGRGCGKRGGARGREERGGPRGRRWPADAGSRAGGNGAARRASREHTVARAPVCALTLAHARPRGPRGRSALSAQKRV